MIEDNKYFAAYTLKLANFLCQRGHLMRGITDDGRTRHYKAILFDNTEQLRKDVNEFTRLNKKEN